MLQRNNQRRKKEIGKTMDDYGFEGHNAYRIWTRRKKEGSEGDKDLSLASQVVFDRMTMAIGLAVLRYADWKCTQMRIVRRRFQWQDEGTRYGTTIQRSSPTMRS